MENKDVISEIKCPLCGYSKTDTIHEEIDLDIDYSHENFLTRKDSYNICERCQLIFIHPRPSIDSLENYYSNVYVAQSSDDVENSYKSLQYDNTLNFILENTDDIKTIVDIGMSSGFLLSKFKKLKNVKLIGIEPSKEICKIAENEYGVKALQGQLEEIDLEKENLMGIADIVICSHVLEHIIDPGNFLKKLTNIIKPKGFLYIEVPSNLILRNFKDAIYGRNIHHLHINQFMASNLNYACHKLQFYPVNVFDDFNYNYPVLRALYIKQSPISRAKDVFNGQINIIEDFFKNSHNLILNSLKSNHEQIVLWGGGHDLFHLIRRYPELSECERLVLVDKNPIKISKDFFGMKIHDPLNVEWDNVSEIFITPSEGMLKIDIKKDIEKNFSQNVKISFLFE